MRLSELSTDGALDALCELSPYVANIIEDEKIASALDRAMPKKAEDKEQEDKPSGFSTGLRMFGEMGKLTPILLKDHRGDVYGILSVMNGKSKAEIAAQSVQETVRQMREVFQDEDLLSFFRSSAQQEQTGPSVPSAVSHG